MRYDELQRGRIDLDELASFVQRVSRLQAEGLTKRTISERLGVPYSTINDRLNRWKEHSAQAQTDSVDR